MSRSYTAVRLEGVVRQRLIEHEYGDVVDAILREFNVTPKITLPPQYEAEVRLLPDSPDEAWVYMSGPGPFEFRARFAGPDANRHAQEHAARLNAEGR